MQKRALIAALTSAAGCFASAAFAQTDVIVGDLQDVSNYTTGGAIGGMHAYSVGTYSCNQGTTPLPWVQSTTSNLYPVISQNMYRLVNGRFEQIGQAWLKHGFCALNNPLCGSCPTPSGCETLMPGCADPYGSGLNGSQSGLGPKHVVNPSTGVFPSGATAASLKGTSVGDATLKARLQVAQADMQSAGALYFVSSTYMHPSDGAANTDNNNQSYRRVLISSTNYAMSLTDNTHREMPAIQAWREYGSGTSGGTGVIDPTVTLVPIDIASDGRFWVGSKVIAMGGGQYRYEYAVYNHNSNRGAQGFSVPVPAGATVTSNYFHDVPYHSGEVQTGDDWAFTNSGGNAAWNYLNNQAVDKNENILRWDTIYNFSFVCDRLPTTGNVSLALFGAASPTSVTAALQVPGTATGGGGPANDACSSPTVVGGGATSFTTVGATTDGPVECLASGDNTIGSDVWFLYTSGTCTDPTTITTCGSSFDTKLAVYQGSACPTLPGTAIACNDDTAGCTGGTAGLGSSVTITPTPNTSYLIRVGGYTPTGGTTTSGNGTLTITPGACAPVPPANDACANAFWAADGTTYTGSTTLATLDGTASCGAAATTPDVWYKYRPLTTGTVNISTCGSNYDTVLSVHSACGGASTDCNDDSACASNGLNSLITKTMTAGVTYYIRVSGYNGSIGDFSLLITGGGGVVPPSNDNCVGRIGFSGTQAFSTIGATTDGTTTSCGQVFNDIWYNHPASCTGTATVTATGTGGFAPSLAIYNGSACGTSPFMTCADAIGSVATVTFPVTALSSYLVRVGGNADGLVGAGSLTVTCTPAGPTCDTIDFNGDSLFPDSNDIDDFLSVFSGGPCSTGTCGDIDFNNDGLFPDSADIDALLSVFSGGPCL